jgi:HlyD family secretion protein
MNKKSSPRRRRLIRILALLGSVSGVAFGIAAILEPDPIRAEVGIVDRGAVSVTVREEGRTQVRDRYTIHAPRAGVLVRPGLRVGDPVRSGITVIAVLGPTDPAFVDLRRRAVLEAQLDAATARIDAARAALGEAEARCQQAWRELHRAEQMAASRIASDEEVERRHAAATVAERARDAMQADLDAARHLARAAELEIRGDRPMENGPPSVEQPGEDLALLAPVDGCVLRVFEESGRPVTAGQPLVEVGDPGQIEVRVAFLSHDALLLKPGMPARIGTSPGFGPGVALPLEGEVSTIEPRAETVVSALGVEEQRVDVLLEPRGDWPVLGDGFHVEVSIEVDRSPRDAVRAPAPSLFRHEEGWAVHRVDEAGRSWITRVDVGLIDPSHAEVIGGLTPGDRVVLYPSRWIEDGRRVVAPTGR